MKALILAAGFGTRLLPHTRTVPKPLFTVAGRPLLDILIRRLAAGGCESVIVNTHHLHEKIRAFLADQTYPIPVAIRHEKCILGTGGAIRNVADFWDHRPFMVVNSDILTDVDFAEVYRGHLARNAPATLVLYDDPQFNTVSVTAEGLVSGFGEADGAPPSHRRLTFSGIQVLDPAVLACIPEGFSSSIDAYRKILADGGQVRGVEAPQARWSDLGTPERYRRACVEVMAAEAFARAGGSAGETPFRTVPLSGDGSDRRWFRLVSGERSLILADHGIHVQECQGEAGAFEDIGRHLFEKQVAVPRIHHADRFSGLVFLEDLGDVHLQEAVLNAPGEAAVEALYRQVIRRMIPMWLDGIDGFDPGWTWQTARYDREMVLSAECGYFRDAFLRGYLGMDLPDDAFEGEFERIAGGAVGHGTMAFMHRDMQSRNIMVSRRGPCFIDFQGGRIGPAQYDLASLLIDPYTALPGGLRERLLGECIRRMSDAVSIDRQRFAAGYRYCCLSRNLQMLGAFGFLTRVKGKSAFEAYIPRALGMLPEHLDRAGAEKFPGLRRLAGELAAAVRHGRGPFRALPGGAR